MLRLFWYVIADEGSLWARFVREKYLRSRSIWLARPPSGCSWAWRGILGVRDIAREWIRYKIGDGSTTRFFQYPWCGRPLLCEHEGERLQYDMGVPKDTLVSYFIRDGAWQLPPPRSSEMFALWPCILGTPIHGGRDGPFRLDAPREGLTIKELWTWVVPKGVARRWTKLVWFPCHIPKHAITLWRALRGRLVTKAFMRQRGATHSLVCALCERADEDMDHLFWACPYTRGVWMCVRLLVGLGASIGTSLIEEGVWVLAHKQDNQIAKWAYGAVVYECWQERNRRIFDEEKSRVQDVVTRVNDAVRAVGTSMKQLQDDERARECFVKKWA